MFSSNDQDGPTGKIALEFFSAASPCLFETINFSLDKSLSFNLRKIAEIKLPDLNCYTVEEAMNIVAGTAKNMGVKVEEN